MAVPFSQEIAVLYSRTTQQRLVSEALERQEVYRFTGASGKERTWLKGEHAFLSPFAARVLLHRGGFRHDMIGEDDPLDDYRTLVLPGARHLPHATQEAIRQWLAHDPSRRLIALGPTCLGPDLLGLREAEEWRPAGYTGWSFDPGGPFGDQTRWGEVRIAGYRGHTTVRARAAPGSQVLADLWEFTGDVSGPQTARRIRLGAGVVAAGQTLFVAAPVLELLGGTWQAHLNVEDVRYWADPVTWGDVLAHVLLTWMGDAGTFSGIQTRLQPFGTYSGALSLRHDCDKTDDLTMLQWAVDELVPSTYALLDPVLCADSTTEAQARLWSEATARNNFIEADLHNDSLAGDPPVHVMGTGLLDHFTETEKRLGIRFFTGCRHGGFHMHPETIDAMEHLYDRRPDILGLCTFCFYALIEYGVRYPGRLVQGKAVTYTTFTQELLTVPGFWFPFHPVVTTSEMHRPLPGWDINHDSEYDCAALERLLSGRLLVHGGPTLPNGAYCLQYHPMSARDPELGGGRGVLPWLKYAVLLADRHNLWTASKRMLYERMRDFEAVRLRGTEGGVHLQNAGNHEVHGVVLQIPAETAVVRAGSAVCIHRPGLRLVTAPPLAPGETLDLRFEPARSGPAPRISEFGHRGWEVQDARWDPAAGLIRVRLFTTRRGHLTIRNLPPGTACSVRLQGARAVALPTAWDRPWPWRDEILVGAGTDGSLRLALQADPDHLVVVDVTIQMH